MHRPTTIHTTAGHASRFADTWTALMTTALMGLALTGCAPEAPQGEGLTWTFPGASVEDVQSAYIDVLTEDVSITLVNDSFNPADPLNPGPLWTDGASRTEWRREVQAAGLVYEHRETARTQPTDEGAALTVRHEARQSVLTTLIVGNGGAWQWHRDLGLERARLQAVRLRLPQTP